MMFHLTPNLDMVEDRKKHPLLNRKYILFLHNFSEEEFLHQNEHLLECYMMFAPIHHQGHQPNLALQQLLVLQDCFIFLQNVPFVTSLDLVSYNY